MRNSIAKITLLVCAAGATTTAILFALAIREPYLDPSLERLLNDAGGWAWAITPYSALAAVAVGFRRRPGASLLVLCVTTLATLYALVDTREYLRPLSAGAHEFARGLGYGTPIVLYLAAIGLAIAIKCADGVCRLLGPSPCKH
jgi:hypothetical protein